MTFELNLVEGLVNTPHFHLLILSLLLAFLVQLLQSDGCDVPLQCLTAVCKHKQNYFTILYIVWRNTKKDTKKDTYENDKMLAIA